MASAPDRQDGCPLCGAQTRRRLVTKMGFDVVRCTACGLVYVWPPPGADELEALYSGGDYHAVVDEGERRRTFARRLRQIEAICPERGRLLDVGCSKGFFLDVARDAGWDVAGVELNRNAADEARGRGLDVWHGDLAAARFDPASFDVVTLFDVIEHTSRPRDTLAACRRVLRPGGLLVATTPDVGGLVPRVTYALFACTLGAWDHPTPPGHLVQFSRRTLRQLLESEKFAAIAERSEHIPMAYSVGKLENSVLDVLAGRHRRRPERVVRAHTGAESGAQRPRSSPLRCLPRLGVRGAAWLVIGLAGLLARATRWGDSRWVAARQA